MGADAGGGSRGSNQSNSGPLHRLVGAVPSRNHSTRDGPHQSSANSPLAMSIARATKPGGGRHAVSIAGLCQPLPMVTGSSWTMVAGV